MTPKPVVPRELARRDVEEAIDHYLHEASEQVTLAFVDALEAAYAGIARHPAAGSPRYAHELGIPGLRVWGLRRYPYIVFYREQPDHVDVWRVLHGQRDIATWMQGAEPSDLADRS
jgi:toxin ParE1/3/4